MKFNYRCSVCDTAYDLDPALTVCPSCSKAQEKDQPLAGVLEVALDGKAGPDFRISDLLPVPERYFPPIPVGNTPLWGPENLRKTTGFPKLYIKDDGVNPTFSFKDRASFLVSAFARRHGITDIALASTGNAGSSMAGIGAAAGQRITLFLPESAPRAKLVQALQYGARVFRVAGTYDLAYDLSLEYTRRMGGMNRNTAYNPMTLEGKKTAALEVFKQLGRLPDTVFVSCGDGCILSGLYKGFRDLQLLGITQRIPRIIAVQAEGSNALFRAWNSGRFTPVNASTKADSISVDVPRNGAHALSMIKRYHGAVVTVSDQAILRAQACLAATSGLFTEPAGAASLAGFLKAAPGLDPDSLVVVMATGSGLKDVPTATQGITLPETVIRSVDDIC